MHKYGEITILEVSVILVKTQVSQLSESHLCFNKALKLHIKTLQAKTLKLHINTLQAKGLSTEK